MTAPLLVVAVSLHSCVHHGTRSIRLTIGTSPGAMLSVALKEGHMPCQEAVHLGNWSLPAWRIRALRRRNSASLDGPACFVDTQSMHIVGEDDECESDGLDLTARESGERGVATAELETSGFQRVCNQCDLVKLSAHALREHRGSVDATRVVCPRWPPLLLSTPSR